MPKSSSSSSSSSKVMPAAAKCTGRKRGAAPVGPVAKPSTVRQRMTYSQSFKLEVVRHSLRLPPSARIKPTCRAYPGIEPVQIRKWIRNLAPLAVLMEQHSNSDCSELSKQIVAPSPTVQHHGAAEEEEEEEHAVEPTASYTDLENLDSCWRPSLTKDEAASAEIPCGLAISRVSSTATSTATTPLYQSHRPSPTPHEQPSSWSANHHGYSAHFDTRSLHPQPGDAASRAFLKGSLRSLQMAPGLPGSNLAPFSAQQRPVPMLAPRGVSPLYACAGVSSPLNPSSPLVGPSVPVFSPLSGPQHLAPGGIFKSKSSAKPTYEAISAPIGPASSVYPTYAPYGWTSRISTPPPEIALTPPEASNEREVAAHELLSLFQGSRA